MDNTSKIFVVLGLVLGLASLITLVVILLQPAPRDPIGFFQICWQDNGLANFDTTLCTSPEPLVWPRSPLRVQNPSLASEAHRELLRAAIGQINEEVGCEVFELVGSQWDQPYEVAIFFDVPVGPEDRGLGGATAFVRNLGENQPQRAYVDIFGLGVPGGLTDLIIRHEFGHVLGLDHDEPGLSIMRPRQENADQANLTSEDRERLRTTYCH